MSRYKIHFSKVDDRLRRQKCQFRSNFDDAKFHKIYKRHIITISETTMKMIYDDTSREKNFKKLRPNITTPLSNPGRTGLVTIEIYLWRH